MMMDMRSPEPSSCFKNEKFKAHVFLLLRSF